LFNEWYEWASAYKEPDDTQSNIIRPLGELIAPDWMKNKFEGLEDFYIYYNELIEAIKDLEEEE